MTETGLLRALWEDELVGEIPARLLTEECPRYVVEQEPRPASAERPVTSAPSTREALLEPARIAEPLLTGLRLPPLRPARAVAHRSPPRVSTLPCSGFVPPGAAWRCPSTAPDASGSLDPFTGGALAVLEAARNVACVGGEPLGLTDCLNFGNPEKPEIGWELAEAIEGMAQACEALGVPVVSGNVSLYNDTDGTSIPPDARRRLRGARRRTYDSVPSGVARG